jgi:PBSX family phage terminase large subunit
MAGTVTVQVKPFSKRYVDYYTRCFHNRINCLEGAYRAGKSVINIFSFANYLEYCEDKLHLVSGASIATARLNVADCNGLGLKYLFRGRFRTGEYEGNECIRISTKKGEKIVIFVGGSKSDSYKKIQGLSFGSWLSVELANLYISDDEKCFIDMAISRLTQSKDAKIWWDLNPVYPSHKVYQKYLDKFEEEQKLGVFVGGYNFMRCSLFDNTALTEEQINNFISLYPDKNSMEYQRYVMGNRACAEGIIFRLFAKDNKPWLVDDFTEYCRTHTTQFISIGVDFGGNGSNTTFVATLFSNNFHDLLILKDAKLEMTGGEKDVEDFHRACKEFVEEVLRYTSIPLRYIWGDCADPVMINEIRNVIRDLGKKGVVRVLNCKKWTIKERIDTKMNLIAKGHWKLMNSCNNVIDSTATQVWNNKEGHEDERLDDGTTDIDTADAEEYSWSGFLEKLIKYCN